MKRILTIGITLLLTGMILTKSISAIVLTSKPRTYKPNPYKSILNMKLKQEILNEIRATSDKILIVDKIISDRKVKYWEHLIGNIFVINDSILLHMDYKYENILEYKRSWSEIEVISINFGKGDFDGEYHWKRKVVFPEAEDCGLFYTFMDKQKYPLFCWEVRYTDGNTIYYDLNETLIGYGVAAPSERGLVLQGEGDSKWRYWRENAQIWYGRWFSATNSIKCPSNEQISYFIKNKTTDTEAFYVIAHSGGDSTRFLAKKNTYYTASQLHNDMIDRGPMKLSILCCCETMNQTGQGTLSFELRKGEINGTVTIGFIGMGNCPNWVDSLYWQDYMFEKIDKGYTIKRAFDRACAQYPQLIEYVRFIGDPHLKINDGKSCNSKKSNIEFIEAIYEVMFSLLSSLSRLMHLSRYI